MKAKIKSTGEIIDVISWSAIGTYVCFINAHGEEEKREINYYKDLEILGSIDWEQRRYELAKAAMQVELSLQSTPYPNAAVEYSVYVADLMISELKKQKP